MSTFKPVSEEDIYLYATYILIGEGELTKEEASRVAELHNEVTTLSNVVLMSKYLNRVQDRLNNSFIDTLQIQQRVIEEMGATGEMFTKAQKEYTQVIEDAKKELESRLVVTEEKDFSKCGECGEEFYDTPSEETVCAPCAIQAIETKVAIQTNEETEVV